MTQLGIDFAGVVVPKNGTQKHELLLAFRRGERLTVLTALELYGVYALSQRCGELIRDGWPIQSRTIVTRSGKTVSEYWMDAQ